MNKNFFFKLDMRNLQNIVICIVLPAYIDITPFNQHIHHFVSSVIDIIITFVHTPQNT